MARGGGGTIAVSLHDVEPATFERCALIRDWLDDLGVDRVTLLVIPAPDLHPFHDLPAQGGVAGDAARLGKADGVLQVIDRAANGPDTPPTGSAILEGTLSAVTFGKLVPPRYGRRERGNDRFRRCRLAGAGAWQ